MPPIGGKVGNDGPSAENGDWRGHGDGWEIEVVEVKYKDKLSPHQEVWLRLLRDVGVSAYVTRVASTSTARARVTRRGKLLS